MRSLPVDQNADLVVRVIKTKLESVNVHLPEIIGDATRKQQGLEERLAELRGGNRSARERDRDTAQGHHGRCVPGQYG